MASPGGAGGADGAAVAGGGVASSSSSPDAVTEDDLAEFLAAVDGCDGPQEGPWEPPFFSRETSSTGCTVASMRHRRSTRGPTQLRVLSEYELGPEGLSPEVRPNARGFDWPGLAYSLEVCQNLSISLYSVVYANCALADVGHEV